MKKTFKLDIPSGLLAALFIYTAVSKLLNITAFNTQLTRQPLPAVLVGPLVWLLPLSEVFTACLLLFDRTRRIGFYVSTMMMLVFTVYVGLAAFHFFESVPCACGGVIGSFSWNQHFWFNAFFLLLSLLGIVISNRERRQI